MEYYNCYYLPVPTRRYCRPYWQVVPCVVLSTSWHQHALELVRSAMEVYGGPSISSVWMGCQAPFVMTWANGGTWTSSPLPRTVPWRFVLISRRLVLARTTIGRASDRSSKDRLLMLAAFNSHDQSLCANSTQNAKLQGPDFFHFFFSSASQLPRLSLPRPLVLYHLLVLSLSTPSSIYSCQQLNKTPALQSLLHS
ncbi:hypothetical protein V8C37DRAFT_216417 [Trichoderma ceciliae]